MVGSRETLLAIAKTSLLHNPFVFASLLVLR